jgi:hypothetical protein
MFLAPPTSFRKIDWRRGAGLDQPLDVLGQAFDRPKIGDLPGLDMRGLHTKCLFLMSWLGWPYAEYERD